MRKKEQEEMNQLYLKGKQRLEDQTFVKIKKKQHQELQKLKKEVSKYANDDSSSEEEVVIMKKPKKKVVYIEKPERPVEKQQLPAPTPIRKYVAYM